MIDTEGSPKGEPSAVGLSESSPPRASLRHPAPARSGVPASTDTAHVVDRRVGVTPRGAAIGGPSQGRLGRSAHRIGSADQARNAAPRDER